MTSGRWEKERSAWLKARAGHRPAVRRRAEQLALAARQRNRDEIVAGDSPFGEVTTRNVFHRSVHREEGAANLIGWLVWTLGWMATVMLFVGPALLIGLAAYGLWWSQVPRWGRLRSWPLLVAAAVIAVAGLLAAQIWEPTGWVGFLIVFLVLQLVLGLVRAAWRVRAWGWPAVARVTKASTSKVRPVHIQAADEEPAIAPVEVIESEPANEAPEPLQDNGIAPIELPAFDDEDETDNDDDLPGFSDEDAGFEHEGVEK
ncbi:hypothetical protein CGZ95_08900 [Enemella evansiae]|uniref:hypothetical protein n=1 Tax=Enemella evansiae TaxID=2016499 RepID=UPI000B9760F8|nr:hypothetical protein [Enemella evansiae]OYO00730.1 hypothetical protein CGZ95_08900 [Enemella evansiae]